MKAYVTWRFASDSFRRNPVAAQHRHQRLLAAAVVRMPPLLVVMIFQWYQGSSREEKAASVTAKKKPHMSTSGGVGRPAAVGDQQAPAHPVVAVATEVARRAAAAVAAEIPGRQEGPAAPHPRVFVQGAIVPRVTPSAIAADTNSAASKADSALRLCTRGGGPKDGSHSNR